MSSGTLPALAECPLLYPHSPKTHSRFPEPLEAGLGVSPSPRASYPLGEESDVCQHPEPPLHPRAQTCLRHRAGWQLSPIRGHPHLSTRGPGVGEAPMTEGSSGPGGPGPPSVCHPPSSHQALLPAGAGMWPGAPWVTPILAVPGLRGPRPLEGHRWPCWTAWGQGSQRGAVPGCLCPPQSPPGACGQGGRKRGSQDRVGGALVQAEGVPAVPSACRINAKDPSLFLDQNLNVLENVS